MVASAYFVKSTPESFHWMCMKKFDAEKQKYFDKLTMVFNL